jgi:hypothetical protein
MTKQNLAKWYFLGALTLLGLNLFLISPILSEKFGSVLGNGVYIGIRLGVIVFFSFLINLKTEIKRLAVIRFTTFLVFIEQTAFKAIYLYLDFMNHPQNWVGIDQNAAIFGTLMSYVVSVPLIVILAFLGTELSLLVRSREPLTNG